MFISAQNTIHVGKQFDAAFSSLLTFPARKNLLEFSAHALQTTSGHKNEQVKACMMADTPTTLTPCAAGWHSHRCCWLDAVKCRCVMRVGAGDGCCTDVRAPRWLRLLAVSVFFLSLRSFRCYGPAMLLKIKVGRGRGGSWIQGIGKWRDSC